MSDHHHHVVIDAGDPVSEILQTFRAPTGPGVMSRARRLARAAHAAVLSGYAHCMPTAITVDGSEGGGYVVEVRVASHVDLPPDLGRAIAQCVRETAADRGLGTYVDEVAIVVEGVR
jgi:hypothetical protein